MPRFEGIPVESGPRFGGIPVEAPVDPPVQSRPAQPPDPGNPVIGAGEAALQFGTGLGSQIAGGLAGLATPLVARFRAPGLGREDVAGAASNVVQDIQESGTIQPTTQAGIETSEGLMGLIERATRAARVAPAAFGNFAPTEEFRAAQDPQLDRSRETGFARVLDEGAGPVAGGNVLETTGSPLAATLTEIGPTALLQGAGLRASLRGRPLSHRQQVARNAQEEIGLVADPASTGVSGAASLAEGLGGKAKVQQALSVRNQPRVNAAAARSIGLAEDAVLTPEVLSGVRAQAGQAFEALRGQGTVNADIGFKRALSKAVAPLRQTGKDFKTLGKRNKKPIAIADDLNRDAFDFDSGVTAIQELRELASKAFRDGESQRGQAFRDMSKAIEDVMDRELLRRGLSDEVNAMRAAREQIAKTYTIERALVGSDVAAANLAGQLKQGKPLSGELRTVAEFAQEFPKLSRVIKDVPTQFSALDFMLSGGGSALGGLITGSATGALPAIALLGARPALRGLAQSSRVPARGSRIGPAAAAATATAAPSVER